MFAYCNNNPILYTDKAGTIPTIKNTTYINDGGFVLSSGNTESGAKEITDDTSDTKIVSPMADYARGGIIELSEGIVGTIGRYSDLRKLTSGTDFQVHHLVEIRFKSVRGLNSVVKNYYNAPCIVVTKSQHQVNTNYLRKAYPYRKTQYNTLNLGSLKENFLGMYKTLGRDLDIDFIASLFE